MTHTAIVFSESVDEAGADHTLNPVSDPTISSEGDFNYVPQLNLLLGAYAALGSTGVRAYLETPSLRRLQMYHISPIELALMPTGNGIIGDQTESPIALDINEGMRAYSQADPASAEQHTIVAFLADKTPEPITGEIIHARATASATEAAGAWALSELSFEDVLPDGTYQVVGARVECAANGVAFRLVPIGSFFRPAGLCVNSKEAKDWPKQRDGGLGVWFEFNPRTPPSVEVLASAAGGTAQTVYLDLIKTA